MAQTISGEKAQWGLSGNHEPALPGVANDLLVGTVQGTQSWTDADILYTFQVTATGATDKVTLTLSSGAKAQTTGTPTISPSAAEDPEGQALATLATLYAVLTTAAAGNTGTVSVNGNTTEPLAAGGAQLHVAGTAGQAITSETWDWTNTASADVYTVTILGKA